ncbi:uncharacterized protein H6S33_008197 [Morchella sextelata]|uniref:uncharacterized protein n=1 Tax=Morchella sextelata TaxID=1174677 RepID=UPI001D05AF4F|nr:uncharacterized protein H6S33_008197 [Morchella sextelata]KAH0603193.1 hypothetical protein H6S33_008197 [Morchella sextelata]
MFHADPTSEASSAASPDVVPPPFLAGLDSLSSEVEAFMLNLQTDKTDSLRRKLESDIADVELLVAKLRGVDRRGSDADVAQVAQLDSLTERMNKSKGLVAEESALLEKMIKLVEDSRRLRVAMREREQGTEKTLNERDKLREDVRREKELHQATMTEVEALRRQLGEEKKLHEETRLARDQFSEQNNKQKELCEESHKKNKVLLEEIWKWREVHAEMKSEIVKLRAELLNLEETKSVIEKLHAGLLKEKEHLREKIKGEMKQEQAEQERSRLVRLEQQARKMRNSEQTTARD